eukprot:gene7207-9724_t
MPGLVVDIEARIDKLEKGIAKANATHRRGSTEMENRARQSAKRMEDTYAKSGDKISGSFERMFAGFTKAGAIVAGIGATVLLKVSRNGTQHEASLKLEQAPEGVPRDERLIDGRNPFAGALVANLSPRIADALQMATDAQGVVIEEVTRGSPAARLGFAPKDIIININGQDITSTEMLAGVVDSDPGLWRVEIERQGQRISADQSQANASRPLADRLRPKSLTEVSGQPHLTGPDGALTRMIDAKSLGSMIFWGPPGTGKTT